MNIIDNFKYTIDSNSYNIHPIINITDSFILGTVIMFAIIGLVALAIYYFKVSADVAQKKDNTTFRGLGG